MMPEQIEIVRQMLILARRELYHQHFDMMQNFYYLRGVLFCVVSVHHYDLMDAEDLFIPYIRFMIGDLQGISDYGSVDDRVFSGVKGKA